MPRSLVDEHVPYFNRASDIFRELSNRVVVTERARDSRRDLLRSRPQAERNFGARRGDFQRQLTAVANRGGSGKVLAVRGFGHRIKRHAVRNLINDDHHPRARRDFRAERRELFSEKSISVRGLQLLLFPLAAP